MIKIATDWLIFTLFGFERASRLGKMIHFFFYDSVKIILLLFFMISVIGFLRSYLPPEKVKEWIAKKKYSAHIFASLFGALTPFCTCSSIPIFLSFLKAGIPLGVTFSFLITSPIINEYLAILMFGFFGWKITVVYVLSGIIIGVIAGIVLGKLKRSEYIIQDIINPQQCAQEESSFTRIKDRILYGISEARRIVKSLWIWVLIGVGIGAVIHNYVPQQTVQLIISKTGVFSVPLATLLGVPMYGSCAAIVPIAVVLFKKGIPLGTALAFMMATAALSLPEAIILKRAMKVTLISIFFSVVTIAIILTGYMFNALQKILTT